MSVNSPVMAIFYAAAYALSPGLAMGARFLPPTTFLKPVLALLAAAFAILVSVVFWQDKIVSLFQLAVWISAWAVAGECLLDRYNFWF
jgi:hypothetical protein